MVQTIIAFSPSSIMGLKETGFEDLNEQTSENNEQVVVPEATTEQVMQAIKVGEAAANKLFRITEKQKRKIREALAELEE